MGKFMYCYKHSLLPSRFNDLFYFNYRVHNYDTRCAHDFYLTHIHKISVSFQGPVYFNSFATDITYSNSLPLLKGEVSWGF